MISSKSKIGLQLTTREVFIELALYAEMRMLQLHLETGELTGDQAHLRFELARALQLEQPQLFLEDHEWFTLLDLAWSVVEAEGHTLSVPMNVKKYLTYLQGLKDGLVARGRG